MYKFWFNYSDGTREFFNEVEKIEYQDGGKSVSVSEDELYTHKFPTLKDYQIYTKTTKHILSREGLRKIDIEKH